MKDRSAPADPPPVVEPAASRARCRRRNRGFTIFELSMAVFVMAFALTTAVTVLQMGFRSLDTARNTTIASQLLQSVMEDMRMLPWNEQNGNNSITLLQATSNGVIGNANSSIRTRAFTNDDPAAIAMVNRFEITRTITDYSSVLKKIQLSATWRGIDEKSHSLTYTSYYGQFGLHDYIVR